MPSFAGDAEVDGRRLLASCKNGRYQHEDYVAHHLLSDSEDSKQVVIITAQRILLLRQRTWKEAALALGTSSSHVLEWETERTNVAKMIATANQLKLQLHSPVSTNTQKRLRALTVPCTRAQGTSVTNSLRAPPRRAPANKPDASPSPAPVHASNQAQPEISTSEAPTTSQLQLYPSSPPTHTLGPPNLLVVNNTQTTSLISAPVSHSNTTCTLRSLDVQALTAGVDMGRVVTDLKMLSVFYIKNSLMSEAQSTLSRVQQLEAALASCAAPNSFLNGGPSGSASSTGFLSQGNAENHVDHVNTTDAVVGHASMILPATMVGEEVSAVLDAPRREVAVDVPVQQPQDLGHSARPKSNHVGHASMILPATMVGEEVSAVLDAPRREVAVVVPVQQPQDLAPAQVHRPQDEIEPPRDLPNPSLIDQEHESVPEDEELELAAEDDQGLDLLAELDELGPEEEYQTASQTEICEAVQQRESGAVGLAHSSQPDDENVPPTSELEAPVCEDDEDQETKDDELLPTPDDEQHADSFTEIEILGLVDGDANTAAQSSGESAPPKSKPGRYGFPGFQSVARKYAKASKRMSRAVQWRGSSAGSLAQSSNLQGQQVPPRSALDAAMRALEEDPEIKDDEIVLAPEDEGDPALLAELAQMELEDGDPNPASQAGGDSAPPKSKPGRYGFPGFRSVARKYAKASKRMSRAVKWRGSSAAGLAQSSNLQGQQVPCPSALDAARRALDNDPEINDDEIVLDMEDEDDPGLLADLKAMHCVDGDPNPVAQAGVRGNRTQIKLKNDQYVVTGFRKFARRCAKVPTRVSRAVQWRGSNPESPAPSS